VLPATNIHVSDTPFGTGDILVVASEVRNGDFATTLATGADDQPAVDVVL